METKMASPETAPRLLRSILAAVSLSLAVLSLVLAHNEERLRDAARKIHHEFAIDRSHPWVPRMVDREPAGDLSCDVVADAVVDDARSALSNGRPGRAAAARAAASVDRELRAARDLMLDALATRPGWAGHRLRLGQLAFWESRRPDAASSAGRTEFWATPLGLAAAAAPGLDEVWVSLGEAYLDAWAALAPGQRAAAPPILKNAFLVPQFVSRKFLSAAGAVGLARAMALLPEASRPLDAAARELATAGDVSGAVQLWERMREAERNERTADLRRVEERLRLGDLPGLRIGCEAWMSAYPVSALDDPVGRLQAARILEICPNDRPGAWKDDARGRLTRFFLDGRESDVRGQVLARAVESLAGIPDAVSARIRLLAGQREAAEELARRSGEPDSAEWSSYLVALARLDLQRGDAARAGVALARLGSAGRETCDALLARRDVARTLQDDAETARAEERLRVDRSSGRSAQAFSTSSAVALRLCLDPEAIAESVLGVQIDVASPAVVAYGWGVGTSGLLAASAGSNIFRISLAGRSGSRTLSVRTLAGGPVEEVRAAVLAPPRTAADGGPPSLRGGALENAAVGP
jgi:hypothetical protein